MFPTEFVYKVSDKVKEVNAKRCVQLATLGVVSVEAGGLGELVPGMGCERGLADLEWAYAPIGPVWYPLIVSL